VTKRPIKIRNEDQLRHARRPKQRRPPENGGHLAAALRARPVWIHAGIA